jgi:hypothetical protein
VATTNQSAIGAASDSFSGASDDVDVQRKSDRLQLLGNITGEIVVFQPMTIREISLGGVQIETTLPFQINSLHDVRLRLGDRTVIVKGRVAHCSVIDVNDELVQYRSGLEFTALPPHVADAINAYIAAVKTARHGE